MVPLPLFKLASLFVRHVSKYGAVRIGKLAGICFVHFDTYMYRV